MKNKEGRPCRLVREDVVGGGTVDKIIDCSWDDVNTVLEGWKHVMANCTKISVEIFLTFLRDNPSYRNLFPSFSSVPDEDLENNRDFLVHARAQLRGLDSMMKNLSGEYEGENEILPVIGQTHHKRGVTLGMMNQLKETVLLVCCDALKCNRREKASWTAVLDYVFRDYVCRSIPPDTPQKDDREKSQRAAVDAESGL